MYFINNVCVIVICSIRTRYRYVNLLNELNINIDYITISVDNKDAISMSNNQTINPKSKHIDIRFHYIRVLLSRNKVKLKYIKSENNLADGFTKYLNGSIMTKFRNSLLTKLN